MENIDAIRTEFQDLIQLSFSVEKVQVLEKKYSALNVGEADKRSILDQSLRDYQLVLTSNNAAENAVTFERYLAFVIELSKKELCSASTPVILLSDLFDIFTLDLCEKLFHFVEANVSVWKQDLFFGPCKNNLLRMCNDLLRRLSRSQNTVFRGRILLFLAKFFPFSERSGLNVVSEFNLDNVTEFIDESAALDLKESMEIDEPSESDTEKKFKIDYNLYSKFLTLQDFFRSPTQCYNKVRWRVFVNSTVDVLAAFNSFKLDKENFELKSPRELMKDSNNLFFAKYLTNPKLLELQLSDVNFRRALLIQFLLVFQYLTSTVKFKLETYELKTDQSDWIKDQTSFVYQLLAETPANSSSFANLVKHVLVREELWNNWKNDGCPEFKIPTSLSDDTELVKPKTRPKKNVADLISDADKQGKYYMGHPELTKLWNVNPNNLEACKAKERDFLPRLDEYFEEAIVQLDPAAGVEEEYKKVNDGNFGWRGLRLLAHRSPYFFTHTNNPINKLPDYLTISLNKLARDLPQQTNGNDEEEDGDVVIKQDAGETQEETIEQEEVAPPARVDQKISEDVLQKVAIAVGDGWKKLAIKLGFDLDDVKGLETEKETDLERAEIMLKVWAEEDIDATIENLEYTLEGLGYLEAVKALIKKEEKPESQDIGESSDSQPQG